MSTTELTIPTDFQTYYDQVGSQNLSGSRLDESARVASEMETEYEYWSQQSPRRPVGSPLSSLAKIGYDEEGNRWASPIHGAGEPHIVGWGIVGDVGYQAGGSFGQSNNYTSAVGVMPGTFSTQVGRDALTIRDMAETLLQRERGRLYAAAEHYARLGAAQNLKRITERSAEDDVYFQSQMDRQYTCPVCGRIDTSTSSRFLHSGQEIEGVTENAPTIRSCVDCWGRANQEWRAGLSKKARR